MFMLLFVLNPPLSHSTQTYPMGQHGPACLLRPAVTPPTPNCANDAGMHGPLSTFLFLTLLVRVPVCNDTIATGP
jgi:hypothetical protein